MAYAPMTQMSPELMTHGWDAANANLKGAVMDLAQTRKNAKAADALYNAMTPAAGADGSTPAHPVMGKDQWQAMGWNDKAATMQGYVQSAALKNAIASGALETARAKYFDARAAQDSNADAADNKFTANYLQATSPQLQAGGVPLVQGGGGFPGGSPLMTAVDGPAPAVNPNPNRNDILRMALQSGMRPEAALARATGLGGDDSTDNPVVVDKSSLPNASIVKLKRGNSFQVVQNPADGGALPDAQPVKDTDGNVLGYRLPTGNPKAPFNFTKTTDLSDDQRQNLIMKHQTATEGLMQMYQTALKNGDTNAATAYDDLIGQHRAAITNLNGKGGNGGSAPKGVTYTDKSGNKFLYTGNAANPATDKNPANWSTQ